MGRYRKHPVTPSKPVAPSAWPDTVYTRAVDDSLQIMRLFGGTGRKLPGLLDKAIVARCPNCSFFIPCYGHSMLLRINDDTGK